MTACACGPAPTTAAPAATPNLLWRDVANVHILCLVVTETGVDRDRLGRRVCERARAFAARGAPVPVGIIEPGDPAVLAPQSLTLLVHVAAQPDGGGRLAALSVRPFRNGGEQSGLLFAAAPRAARLPSSDVDGESLTGPLQAAISESLPWLAAPEGPRPIHP